jgi:hypothetical protein
MSYSYDYIRRSRSAHRTRGIPLERLQIDGLGPVLCI